MKKRFSPVSNQDDLREKLIGLGEDSIRKSYYPELQRQLENLNERVELAELVAEVGQGLTEEQDLRSSLQRCTDALERRTDGAFVRIWVLDSAGESLELQASSGLPNQIDGEHDRICLKDYPYRVGTIARERKPFLTNHVVGNPEFHNQEWVARQGIVSFAGYPLVLQESLVGVIALFSKRTLSETALETLATIANQLAVGIEHFRVLDAYKTALSDAKESHEKVNVVLRSVADALLVVDKDQRILHMNQAAEALLGVALSAVFKKQVAHVTKESALIEYLARIDQYTKPDHDIDLDMTDMSRNEQRVIQARAARLVGSKSGTDLVISLRDVTQDREVARLKSEFITTAAHELRTPLTTIKGFAELLFNEAWDADTQREYLSYILDKSSILESIIDDLLDLNRIESGRGLSLNYSYWNLSNTLNRVITRLRTEFQNYRFKASFPDDLGMIHADHDKVMQVLDNLLNNAIKYSPQNTEISLDAHCSNDILTITVADQGIGMTEEQIAKCFERFYRVDTTDTAVGGFGLGLSIVRYVVEGHNGQVKIKSRPGQGTAVTFTLPMKCQSKTVGLDEKKM